MLPHAIATGYIHSGTIAGKLNGVMPGAHAERLAQRVAVDVGADVLAVLALQEMRDAHRELDDLDARAAPTRRVGERLAVLLGDESARARRDAARSARGSA